jgi:hypothetical protein
VARKLGSRLLDCLFAFLDNGKNFSLDDADSKLNGEAVCSGKFSMARKDLQQGWVFVLTRRHLQSCENSDCFAISSTSCQSDLRSPSNLHES